MEIILQGLKEGFQLVWSLDAEIIRITVLSLQVSMTALLISALLGIPTGAALAIKYIPGRKLFLDIVYTLMGLPPVLAGLIVYLFLTYKGPLGQFELLFTPAAMIIAQVLLAFPIVCGLTARAVMAQRQEVYDTAATLGASRRQAALSIIRESRIGIIAALTTALGRVIAEVGAVTMVGGNIKDSTRVLTTSIVLETRMGNDSRAIAIGMVLMVIAFSIILLINILEKRSFKNDAGIQIT
ncbi:MAG: ABC transporter permease [Syntrophomonas sp.]